MLFKRRAYRTLLADMFQRYVGACNLLVALTMDKRYQSRNRRAQCAKATSDFRAACDFYSAALKKLKILKEEVKKCGTLK